MISIKTNELSRIHNIWNSLANDVKRKPFSRRMINWRFAVACHKLSRFIVPRALCLTVVASVGNKSTVLSLQVRRVLCQRNHWIRRQNKVLRKLNSISDLFLLRIQRPQVQLFEEKVGSFLNFYPCTAPALKEKQETEETQTLFDANMALITERIWTSTICKAFADGSWDCSKFVLLIEALSQSTLVCKRRKSK